MSKRKKNKRKRAKQGTKPPSSNRESTTSDVSAAAPVKKNQRGLLWLALALLVVVAVVNSRRFLRPEMADPLPLPSDAIVSRPLATPSQPAGATRFTSLTPQQTGVDFVHRVVQDHPMSYLYFSSPAGGGTAIGDVTGDGRPDIFIASGADSNRLYVQEESMKFRDASSSAGVAKENPWSCGATMVDINADGRLDIYVANYDSPNQLFINRGDGTFEDRAVDYGLNFTDACLEAAFADYDRDGDLDVYVLMYRYENPAGMPESAPIVMKDGKKAIHPDFEKYYEVTDDSIGFGTYGRWDYLLRNNGNGTFSNVTIEAGLFGLGHGQSVSWWDFNQDGFADIHVGNDFNDPDRIYRNNRDGTFTDVVRETMPHVTWFSMGADIGDVNGDGLPDLLSADMSSTTHFKQKTTMGSMGNNAEFLATAEPRQYMRNALLLNSGVGRFKEAAFLTGLDSTDWTWAVKLADFDCDGWLDAFFTNGSVRSFTDSDMVLSLSERRGKTEWDIYKHTEPLREQNLAFRSEGDLKFADESEAWGLGHVGVSMSAAHGDLDGDGDLDLVVANMDEPISIYRNDSQENNRVTVRLHGLNQNRYGLGAKVTVTAREDRSQVTELHPTRGFLASNQPILHFGCGDASKVDLKIDWPDGTTQEFQALATNSHHEITQQPGLPLTRRAVSPPAMYETLPAPPAFAHAENEFDDYQLQPLLPHRMSRLGPGLASADVNGDGAMDLFLGGAKGSAGRIALRTATGFEMMQQPALAEDREFEDMGANWLDVDQDGDVDLFVASGGNENVLGSELYVPRLYLNDGKGNLERAKDSVPAISQSAGPVAAADFDQDGDVDVFVGGRQVPGKYPSPASSYLLVNDGGKFLDQTESAFGNAVSNLGMVTGALWSDVDNDDDLDLLLSMEWDSIRLFRNDDGRFVDDSAKAGLSSFRGWWTGISSVDVDLDGDMDYIATNMGRNSKYHATDEKPFRIYYGDFEGNGERKLVEAEYEDETLFPVRGKSCSTHAMPSLAQKFGSYKAFAAASLQEIYTPKCLDESYQCSANYLSTAILINDGSGSFGVRSLPAEAQLSPGFGVLCKDFDGDAIPDVFIAQNFFSPQPETGNMDGGLGCLLRGRGDGRFTAVPAKESGVVLPQDASSVLMLDLDGKSGLDLLVSTNNGSAQLLLSRADKASVICKIDGVKSLSEIAGGRIQFEVDGTTQTHEFASGCGYLTQQAPLVVFSNPTGKDAAVKLTLNGKTMTKNVTGKEKECVLEMSTIRQ